MAKNNWCLKKDEELISDKLMGINPCNTCRWTCTLFHDSLIVGRNEKFTERGIYLFKM